MNVNYRKLSPELIQRIREDRKNGVTNPYACPDENSIRRYGNSGSSMIWRPAFVMDVDKVIHNNYYNRYSDKTQVLSCFKNDDISRRALHVQFVSRIARTIGQSLNLNLDLIEAISLGHDIGHTPFGHAGERFLNNLYHSNTGRYFNHNVHSVRVLDKLICRNVSLQVLDGVLCHNGEMEQQEYKPICLDSFSNLDKRVEDCYTDNSANKRQIPSTLEGCVMRISDIIAYLGKDRQDAKKIGLITDDNSYSTSSIGTTNAEIINNMTVSIVEHSYGKPYISMDEDAFLALSNAKKENYELIYGNPKIDSKYEDIEPMFEEIYTELLKQAKNIDKNSILYKHHIEYLKNANSGVRYFDVDDYLEQYLSSRPDDIVVDYIASMTDDYFIDLYKHLFPKGKYKVEYVGYFE